MDFLYCILIGYFIGTVNPSYIIAKIHGFDIREKGSGNAGASNAVILYGTEMHFSFLWNKDKEIERLKNNMK